MLIAITNEGKLGLGILAGLFIAFALLSAFYLPRRNPEFPGNRVGLFVLVTLVLFAGTMVGVAVFASEEGGEHAAVATETAETTETTETGEGPATTGPSEEPQGDAAAGERVFADQGCAACHTLEAAGASGTVGPNLDEAKPDEGLVIERVTNGMGQMPAFGDRLDEKQIQDVAAYVVESTRG